MICCPQDCIVNTRNFTRPRFVLVFIHHEEGTGANHQQPELPPPLAIPVRNADIITVSCALLTSVLLLGPEQQDCVIVEDINMKLFYIQQYHLLLISSNIVKEHLHSTPDGAAAYSTVNRRNK